MIGANTILHLHEGIAVIGADTLVTPTFWLYKLGDSLLYFPLGVAMLGPNKNFLSSGLTCLC
jgi:hypothetical protein